MPSSGSGDPADTAVKGDVPTLVCPRCRIALDDMRCGGCRTTYPIVAGIPDLRLTGDAYLTIDEDRRKAERLAAIPGSAEDLMRAYWAMTPEVPADLAEKYVRHTVDGPRRAQPHLAEIGRTSGRLLDVGCGTGGLLVAAGGRGLSPTGVDIALRWLVVARRFLVEADCEAQLFAADGALLPFAAGSFEVVCGIEVLEHAEDQRGVLHAALDAVRPGGVGYLVTANRHSIAPDPTVGLWGLGYLPRSVAVRYVARRRQTRYGFMRPLTSGQIRAMLGPDSGTSIAPAPLPGAAAGGMRGVATHMYDRCRHTGVGKVALNRLGPFLQVTTP